MPSAVVATKEPSLTEEGPPGLGPSPAADQNDEPAADDNEIKVKIIDAFLHGRCKNNSSKNEQQATTMTTTTTTSDDSPPPETEAAAATASDNDSLDAITTKKRKRSNSNGNSSAANDGPVNIAALPNSEQILLLNNSLFPIMNMQQQHQLHRNIFTSNIIISDDNKHTTKTTSSSSLNSQAQALGSNANFYRVTLQLPLDKDAKLGVMIEDNLLFNMPELVGLREHSPARNVIPLEYQENSCIVCVKSNNSYNVPHQPRTAKQLKTLFELAKMGKTEDDEPVLVEMLLIKTQSLLSLSGHPFQPPVAVAAAPLTTIPEAPHRSLRSRGITNTNGVPNTIRKETASFWGWLEQYIALSEYKKKNGHCNVFPTQNKELALWVKVQRQLRAKCKLEQGRKELLNKIGFGWANPPWATQEEYHWQKQYQALVEYKNQNGHCNVLTTKNGKLAFWVKVQREYKESDKLEQSREDMLNNIGFGWVDPPPSPPPSPPLPPPSSNDDENASSAKQRSGTIANEEQQPAPSWDERYEAIVRFNKRCPGFFPVSGHLKEWLDGQKAAIGSLLQERVQKLLDIGVKFSSEDLQNLREQLGDDEDAYNKWYAENISSRSANNADEDEDEVGDSGTGGGGGGEQQQQQQRQKRKYNKKSNKKSLSRLDEAARDVPFWKSVESVKMFGFERGDDVLKKLQDRIDLLKKANETSDSWKSLVPDDGKEDLYSDREIIAVRHKAIFLIKGYLVAIEKMGNPLKWGECCEEAASQLNGLGLVSWGGSSIQTMNKTFQVGHVFPHPGRIVNEKPNLNCFRILEYFPKAKEMYMEFANENIDRMTNKLMADEFATNILPAIEKESRDKECFDDGSPEQKMLMKQLANPPSSSTMRKWLKLLNIEYDVQCTRRGRNGVGSLSRRSKAAWAAGKYANRRPKGQGLKRRNAAAAEEDEMNDDGVAEGEIIDDEMAGDEISD
ncbi:hypothetical protein ACHAXR_013042 [Thalassiosira sp. AJA248-18]